ncbi:CGNR zinc finger domain-containing protein [Intrasporangium sp.]|uniref:CGNR zinc finger domain-containing protein n=1 Tax=Intrasporangium sp. TaxID=1925024 RepID=UPI00293A5295|nr:CGNR zinc finger domain-containing protein [Intrasporangium sp.]MDV3222871.1 CGNR zinc finger domain-containing protein [Intrasporangium sp.]
MHINPYGQEPVLLAENLANDRPATAAELDRRCREAGVVLERPSTAEVLRRVDAFLDQWVRVVDATAARERADRLNRLLAAHVSPPRLTDHEDGVWHVHYRPDDQTLAVILPTLISMGTALHLTGRGMHRLGRCAAPGCERVYADVSRNGTQRFCSPRCASRDGVRRHRERAGRPASRSRESSVA